MHYRSVLYVLGNLIVLLGVTLLLPLAAAIGYHDSSPLAHYEVLGFTLSIAVSLIGGVALRTLFETDLSRLGNREGVAIVTLTWILFSLLGCLPFIVTGAAGFTDAYFETMSGFSTTGASIFPALEQLPRGLMLWRCQTQWMGGMGIVVLSVAILPILGIGGYRMFKAEVPGGSTFERSAPRIKDTAKVLWITYLTMTVLVALLLRLGGMSFYESLCHAFTTMSTGGFSPATASIAAYPSPWIQWVVISFMFLAGINFRVYQQLFTGPRRQALQNLELQTYAVLTSALIAIVFGVLVWSQTVTGGAEPTLRASAFQVVSIGTTTGFATEDFNRWPEFLRLLLLLLMFVGGCTGSTSGGMKIARLVIIAKEAVLELKRTITPRAVLVVRVNERSIESVVVANIMSFITMYMAIFAIASVLLVLLGMDLISAASASASNLGNIGPGLGSVGPAANYSHVPAAGKWILIGCQLLGRLEIYSVLSLLIGRTWMR